MAQQKIQSVLLIIYLKKKDIATNIGRPINNVKCYVLDKSNQFVPASVVGELYVAGAGVSRGYLNQPKLTSVCFISYPFATESDIE